MIKGRREGEEKEGYYQRVSSNASPEEEWSFIPMARGKGESTCLRRRVGSQEGEKFPPVNILNKKSII